MMEEYRRYVAQTLSEKRAYHSVCVAEEAVKLALHYGVSPEKAEVAGILHDITKEKSADDQLQIFKEFGIIKKPFDLSAPKLLHAQTAALLIQKRFGITDTEIVRAIRFHTTGRAHMTPLEQVLFLADFISADRDYEGVDELRKWAYQDLRKSLFIGVQFTVKELAEQGRPIHPDTLSLYNELLCGTEG